MQCSGTKTIPAHFAFGAKTRSAHFTLLTEEFQQQTPPRRTREEMSVEWFVVEVVVVCET